MYRYENITTQIYGHVALFSETVQKEQFCVGCKSFCLLIPISSQYPSTLYFIASRHVRHR